MWVEYYFEILVNLIQINDSKGTFEAVKDSRRNGWKVVTFDRLGEIEDSTITNPAIAMNIGQIKIGGSAGSDRVSIYYQLMRIKNK